MKLGGSMAQNIDVELASVEVLLKLVGKTSSLKVQLVKIEGSLAQNARFGAPTANMSRLESLAFFWLRRVYG